MSQINLPLSNAVYYSNACDEVFERNINSLKNEFEDFKEFSNIKAKRSQKDLNDMDKMLETIILLESTKKSNTNLENYQVASSFIYKYN